MPPTIPCLFAMKGDTAVPTNPFADAEVWQWVVVLADLTEFEELQAPKGLQPRLSNFIDGGRVFLIEHAEKFDRLVKKRLRQLTRWLAKAPRSHSLYAQGAQCRAVLQAKGF